MVNNVKSNAKSDSRQHGNMPTVKALMTDITYFCGEPCCKNCKYMVRANGVQYRCAVSYEILFDIEGVGFRCPMKFSPLVAEDDSVPFDGTESEEE